MQNMASHIGISVVGVGLGVVAAEVLAAWILGRELRIRPDILRSIAMAGFLSLIFLFRTAYGKMRKAYDQLALTTSEARYHTLKAQMQPHFLFNSLNSLSELIQANPQGATEMTQKLADLYREILENSKHQTASLASELSIVTKYLELERLRFGERLEFEVRVPPHADQIFLPTLLLQTLVENAVKHGISRALEGGKIVIEILPTDRGWYEARLINSGETFRGRKGGGTGLTNTITRLDLLYGDKHRFEIGALTGGGTRVSFLFRGNAVSA